VKLLTKIKQALTHFTKTEWYIFLGLLVVLAVSTFGILRNINQSFLTKVPMVGGTLTEGIIGTPRFINPVLASTDADRDMVSIVYGGLMRKDVHGDLVPDIAEKFTASENGLEYTFTLKDNILFHDDTRVTATDIVFTINKIKDGIVKSPIKSNWNGISVEKLSDLVVKFTLNQPYASFLDNATVGIMPEHLWKDSPIELNDLNINPVGTGSYKISKVGKLSGGGVDYYDLTYFKDFSLGTPYIKKITLKFYQNEEDLITALENRKVEQISSISPEKAVLLSEKGYHISSSVLPRVFGLFFNQNQNQIFTNRNVIKAINLGINKDKIIQEVLSGYGVVTDDPIPPNMIEYQELNSKNKDTYEDKFKEAENILAKDGWKKNEEGFLAKTTTDKNKKTASSTIEFSISTGNAPELATSANFIKQDLERLGIKVEVKTFDIGNLNQIVIRPRKYDSLLFGQIINNESDLFAFWHSSQRKDPGLNVAMYTNTKTDKILEEAFITIDEESRIKKYLQFENEIKKDLPAVFLYSPDFIYVTSKNIKNLSIRNIVSTQDRFLNMHLWYTKTDNVWKVFSN